MPVRVPRTFVFVDLTAFTDYTAINGDDAAGQVLGNFRAVIRDVASSHGVRVAKWLGDGAMIVSVDDRAAIAAALELERRAVDACAPLRLRIGLASGLALLFEGDDYIGAAVNLAARLCDAAGPMEVLMPAEQAIGLPPTVEVTPIGPMALKGFAEPIDVVELGGVLVHSSNDGGELWTRNPFVA